MEELQLPRITLSSMADVQAMALLPHHPLREIEVITIESVRDAPAYLAAINQKTEEGWFCPMLADVSNISRFAELLTNLTGDVLVRLTIDPNNRNALRALRSKGDAIYRLRNRATHQLHLVHLAAPFTNSLARVARLALNRNKAYQLSQQRIDAFAERAEACLNTTIAFPEVAPLPAEHEHEAAPLPGDQDKEVEEALPGGHAP